MKKKKLKKKCKNNTDDGEFTYRNYEHLHNQSVTNKPSFMKK